MSLHKLKYQHVVLSAFGCLSKFNSCCFSPDGFISNLSMLSYLLWAQLITSKNLSSRHHMIVWGPLLPFPPLSLLFLSYSHSLGLVGSLQMLRLEALLVKAHCPGVCIGWSPLLVARMAYFQYCSMVGSEVRGVMCSAASGGTERVSVVPGNCPSSHFPKVKLPDESNRNSFMLWPWRNIFSGWMLGSFEGLSQM